MWAWLLAMPSFAQIKVASLNPILTDLLQQIGGDKVKVVQVMGKDEDVHKFQPGAKQIREMESCIAVFAMGKGLETYLLGLKDSIGEGRKFIEVGRTIPSQVVNADPIYRCCAAHSRSSVDPHWWHNVKNMERAAKVVYKEFQKLDPANSSYYKERGEYVRKNYRNLHNWVKAEVVKIPKEQRILVTAHVAFAYFCKEYGFGAAYIQGLSKESEISAKDLAETVNSLKQSRINAVFPEYGVNPKVLQQIAKETGAKIGTSLYADHIHTSYEDMIRHNVNTIVSELR